MSFLIIVLCGLLACVKVTAHGYLSKGNVKNTADSIYSSCLVFIFTSLVFSVSLRNGFNINIIYYSLAFGIFSAFFQIFYALGLKSGPFSATCMIVNLNMVVSSSFSIIYYNEKLTAVKVAGVIMCLIALFLNTKSDGKKVNLKWFLYTIMAFFSASGIAVTQKIFAKSHFADNIEQFVFAGYLFSFLITLATVIFMKSTKTVITYKTNKRNIITVILIAVSLGAYQYLCTFANSFVDAIVLNPSVSGLATLFQMFAGKIIFKEKFTLKQIFSIGVGITAILLISF